MRLLILGTILLYSGAANAEPLYFAVAENGARVTIHDEQCRLHAVSNLPKRATWEENGNVMEGCAGARPDQGIVYFYFMDDKTVFGVPMQAFKKVMGV